MNKRAFGAKSRRPGTKTSPRPPQSNRVTQARSPRPVKPEPPEPAPVFEVIDRTEQEDIRAKLPFRVLIAVHRPRFRGRVERAVAREGWAVTSLLTKQDPVGQVSKPPYPPEIVILSHDFGRQKDLAIFRAVQKWRSQGMILVGLVEDCETAPETHPESVPSSLCDVCLTPPIKTAEVSELIADLYKAMRGERAPAMIHRGLTPDTIGEEDEDED
ncbi:MAG: hypothetical protein H7308_07120 [Chthonomonadaceae bacterium]|nr:hypothetical protein [Chthonomonadaceae bacterium]